MKKFVYPIFLFIIFFILTFLKLHPSSIGIYYQFFYGNKKDPNLIFGQPRAIRSDEWLVVTPKIIAQVKAGFPVLNENIGLGEVMPVQGCLPYKHWRVVFCQNMLGFFFLPLEQGYSFMRWFPVFLMLLAVYSFFFYLTKDIFLSIFSSLIFFFIPFQQWWSFLLSRFLGYGLFFVLFFIKSLEKKGIRSLIFFILSLYFFLSFVFILYPPFQIASFYAFGFFLLGYLVSKKLLFKRKTIIYGFLLILITGLIIGKFYFEFKDTIDIVRNTVYPGKRFVANSLGNLTFLINGFYNIQLLDDVKGSGPFGNQSEASNFFLLSLFALPVYWWTLVNQIKRKKIDWIFLFFNICFLILLIWFLFPIPSFFAKISLLFLVPQKRAIIGVGIASYLLMFYFLAKISIKKDQFYLFLTFVNTLLIFLVNLYLGFWLKFNYPVFIQNNYKIILISLTSAILLVLLLLKKTKSFLILLLLFSVASTYRVNPIYKGLDPLINTPLANEIRNIVSKTNNRYYFVNYGSIFLESYFYANGAKSLSGVYYHPQFELLRLLDPQKKYEEVYNRYAHVNFFYNPEVKEKFVLFSPDSYGININPCNSVFNKFNATYFIFSSKVNFDCLRIEKILGESNLLIYVYKKENL